MRGALLAILMLVCFLSAESTVSAMEQLKPKISKYRANSLFQQQEHVSNEMIVKFKKDTSDREKSEILQLYGVKELSHIEKGDFSLVIVPKGKNLQSTAAELIKNEQIEFAEPNYMIEKNYTPVDPSYGKQWYLGKIQAPKAWDITKGASTITVSVIDGGVQTNHPDLAGKIVYPYNTVNNSNTYQPDVHGTHVAGIIAASMNKIGIAGIAPGVKIMPINVFSGEYAELYDIAEAIYYAADHGADVINLSLGVDSYSYVMESAAHYAQTKGVVLVAAAGNDDTNAYTYPAALPDVIGVSATDSSDRITDFSNYGEYIDFAAPGVNIYSTVSGSTYRLMSGTSMAAPVISGVSALVLSKNPFLTPAQVKEILRKSVVDLGSKGWDPFYGYGRIDAYKALQNTPAPVSNIVSSSSTFTVTGTSRTAFSFNAPSGTTISLYVQNSKGTTLRKVVSDKKWSGGKFSAVWDGKLDNGMFASTGTYRILAKVAAGGETVYKTMNIKVVDQVTPSVAFSSSSTIFSPAVQGKIVIPYILNKSAKVSAAIYDQAGKPVKTLYFNLSIAGGKRSVTWDGKNSSGKRVADGTYKLTITVTDSKKAKRSSHILIQVDSKAPTGTIATDSNIFKMNGTERNSLKIATKETVFMSAYVTTEQGIKVKKLLGEKSIKAGSYTLSWDGKNDRNEFAAEGNYQYLMELKDAAGNKTVLKSKTIALQDWRIPVIQSINSLNFKTKNELSIPYTLTKAGAVTVQIYKDSAVIKTLQENVPKSKGAQTVLWDGKDLNGNDVEDGTYQFNITVTDSYGLTYTYTGSILVNFTTVEIAYPSVVAFYQGEEIAAEVFFRLSNPANVSVKILDDSGTPIKTVLDNVPMQEGIQSFTWDGSDDDGYSVYQTSFKYVITAKSSTGKETIVSGNINNEEDPSWLTSHNMEFVPSDEDEYYNKQVIFHFDVAQPVKAYIYISEDPYSDYFDEKEISLKKGKNQFTYTKPDLNDLFYVIVYEDELGNEYAYSFWEAE